MHKIDMNTWPRAELFWFFSGVSQPFYSVTFRVDVTNLHAYTKARGISSGRKFTTLHSFDGKYYNVNKVESQKMPSRVDEVLK